MNLASEFLGHGCDVTIVGTKWFNKYIHQHDLSKFNCEVKLTTRHYDLIVVDNYKLQNEDFNFLRKYARKLLVLDDLCNRKIDCDYLWDPTITHKPYDYESLVPNNCELFIGGEYQIFSDAHIDFAKKIKRKNVNTYNHIHLYGGYSNVFKLKEIENFFINIQVPTTYLGVPTEVKRHTNVNKAQEFSFNPIETYAVSKLGVGSPGNMLWERGSIGLPSYVLISNHNQISICEELMSANLLF